jgi:Putative zinc-finger
MESNRDLQLDGHPTGSVLLAALDGELSTQQNSAVTEHVAGCSECAAQWGRLAQASVRLTEFHRSISALPEFELHLPPDPQPASVLGGIKLFLRRPQFFVSAAALAVAVFGIVFWTGTRTAVPISPAPLAAKVPEQTATLAASKPAIPVAPQTPIATTRRPRHLSSTAPSQSTSLPQPPQNPEPNVSTPQTAEVFWYLPYSNPALAAEGAEMVQAELPREAFLMAGVPLANIPAPGPRGRIAADIVIGADGLPRAIRPARQQTSAMVIPTQL